MRNRADVCATTVALLCSLVPSRPSHCTRVAAYSRNVPSLCVHVHVTVHAHWRWRLGSQTGGGVKRSCSVGATPPVGFALARVALHARRETRRRLREITSRSHGSRCMHRALPRRSPPSRGPSGMCTYLDESMDTSVRISINRWTRAGRRLARRRHCRRSARRLCRRRAPRRPSPSSSRRGRASARPR